MNKKIALFGLFLLSIHSVGFADQQLQCPKEIYCNTSGVCTYNGGDMSDWETWGSSGSAIPRKFQINYTMIYVNSENDGVRCSYMSYMPNSSYNSRDFFKPGVFSYPDMPIKKDKWNISTMYKCDSITNECVVTESNSMGKNKIKKNY